MKSRLHRDILYYSAALSAAVMLCPCASAQAPAASPARDAQPLVTVGGQTITQGEYEAKLEATAGKAVLTQLVLTALVRQAAAKAGVMPADKDVDARIAALQRANPPQAQLVSTPAGRDDLITDMALENLRLQGVTASDAEIAAFYADHKAAFTVPSQVQTTMVVSQALADSQRAELLLGDGVSPEAIARTPGLRVAGVGGFSVNMASLPPDVRQKIGQAVLAMKPEQIKTIPVQDKYFLTFKVRSAQPTRTPLLSQIKDEVARQVRLQKAVSPQQELAALYRNSPPTFGDARYRAYFEGGPSTPAVQPPAVP